MPVPAESATRRNADTQPILIGPPPAPAPAPAPAARRFWIGAAAAGLILVGAGLYLRGRPSAQAPGTRGEQAMPAALRPYYDRAVAGDASAMRMLGTMYYNGLNVTPDTREGIRWYRKAAAAGSVAAQKDLEQLGLTPAP